MVWVGLSCINRADFDALGRIMVSHAFDALVGVDDVDCLSLADSPDRAFRLTGATADALVCNLQSHLILPPEFFAEKSRIMGVFFPV
jgi:hypothetical protein